MKPDYAELAQKIQRQLREFDEPFISFNCRVGLYARAQRMEHRPYITRCATIGKTTTYVIRGSKRTWKIKAESIDIYQRPKGDAK